MSLLNQLLDREYFGMKLGLSKIQAVLARLGHPERSFPSIHVAGTNGKGSTSTMLARIAEAAGYRVGLYTSPHLEQINERFQINGTPIKTSLLDQLAREVHALDVAEEPLSFFEFTTAVAFLYFARAKVDLAVIEVGLGGRLDATNVLLPEVTVITSLAKDHEAQLGSRLEQIAAEKAGIIKAGVPLVCPQLPAVVEQVLLQRTQELNAPLRQVENPERHEDGSFSISGFSRLWVPLLGSRQGQNAALAVRALQALQARRSHDFTFRHEHYYQGLARAFVPGRMEIVNRCPWVILDGAHNPEALNHLLLSVRHNFPGKKLYALFGVMADKAVRPMLHALRAADVAVTLTVPASERALPLSDLGKLAYAEWKHALPAYAEPIAGLEHLLATLPRDAVLLVTGSYYLVGMLRRSFFATARKAA